MHRFAIATLASLALLGCHAETVEAPSPGQPSEPPAQDEAQPHAIGAIEIGGTVSGALSGERTPPGYVVALARGARVTATLNVAEHAGVLVYGPLVGGWQGTSPIARGGARVELTVPADGTYLFAVRGPAGSSAAFSLDLACAGGECRAVCGPDLTCPTGSTCAVVQCIRAPCPSYCEAQVASEPTPSTGGAMCGTRGTGPCPEGSFCDFPPSAQCGEFDAPGTCRAIPQACTREYRPVCGCDRETYPTACTANAAGVSVRSEGACEPTPGAAAPGPRACVRGGCGGELCHEEGDERASICVARPEHACYQRATCERQPSGECGYTQTPELRACLAHPPPMR